MFLVVKSFLNYSNGHSDLHFLTLTARNVCSWDSKYHHQQKPNFRFFGFFLRFFGIFRFSQYRRRFRFRLPTRLYHIHRPSNAFATKQARLIISCSKSKIKFPYGRPIKLAISQLFSKHVKDSLSCGMFRMLNYFVSLHGHAERQSAVHICLYVSRGNRQNRQLWRYVWSIKNVRGK